MEYTFRKHQRTVGTVLVQVLSSTVNFGYKRFRYKGFLLKRDYVKGP